MLATYGVDILDPATSLRRVKVLTERLPGGAWPDSEHPMNWSTEAWLLAQLIDEVAALHYTTVRAAGGRARRPEPFRRPRARRRPPLAAARGGGSWSQLAELMSSDGGFEMVVVDG